MNDWLEEIGMLPVFSAGLWARGLKSRLQVEDFFSD